MREIAFRGKRVVNGEWVYGYYEEFVNSENHFYWINEPNGDFHDVIPETVGQYTGLKDRNGVEIYEGDVLECKVSSEMFVVEFDAKTAQFTTKSNWLWSILDRCEVIGNIHDNPELMGEKK